MSSTIITYYWKLDELSAASRQLVAALDAAEDPQAWQAAYRALLTSDDVAAKGVALGMFLYEQSQSRWGFGNPMDELADEIVAQARVLLAVQPEPGVPVQRQPTVEAAWSSAVGVLDHLGDATDLPRLVDVLTTAVADDVHDANCGELVEFGFSALGRCLWDADEPTRRRVAEWLAGYFTDESRPWRLRALAIRALHGDEDSAPHGQEPVLADLLGHPDLQVAGEAGWALVGRPGYDALVREVAATWPARDVPEAVSQVRWAIEDADELAEVDESTSSRVVDRPHLRLDEVYTRHLFHNNVKRV